MASQGASQATTAIDDEVVPSIIFTDVPSVFTRLSELLDNNDTLIVENIAPSDFRALEAERDRRGEHSRLFYQPDNACLIITVPTLSHNQMHLLIYREIDNAINAMGASSQWEPIGDTTHNVSNGSSGQGDSAGCPTSRRDSEWPTLVVEAGFSQTRPSLRAKMRWWFAASGHQVKVVILVKMQRAQETILVEKWVEVTGRRGATATRWATNAGLTTPQPACERAIETAWAGHQPVLQTPKLGRVPSLFRVTGGPLIIRFAEIFLRAPVAQEHDITISAANLQYVASRIWQRL